MAELGNENSTKECTKSDNKDSKINIQKGFLGGLNKCNTTEELQQYIHNPITIIDNPTHNTESEQNDPTSNPESEPDNSTPEIQYDYKNSFINIKR